MKVTDMTVGTVFIATKGRTEVAQECFILLGFGPVPPGLGHHSGDGVLLDGMRGEDPMKSCGTKKLREVWQSQIMYAYLNFKYMLLDVWEIQIGLVGSSGMTVYEHISG